MLKDKLYISVDIETNGSTAGLHSMISCGAIAARDGLTLDTFEANIYPYQDLTSDIATMKWWNKFSEQYKLTQQNQITPYEFCNNFKNWLKEIEENNSDIEIILVHHNAPFDFSFLRYYWQRELNLSLFFTALDTKALAFATNNFKSFHEASKANIKKHYNILGDNKHTALADAEEQLIMLYAILKDLSNDN